MRYHLKSSNLLHYTYPIGLKVKAHNHGTKYLYYLYVFPIHIPTVFLMVFLKMITGWALKITKAAKTVLLGFSAPYHIVVGQSFLTCEIRV